MRKMSTQNLTSRPCSAIIYPRGIALCGKAVQSIPSQGGEQNERFRGTYIAFATDEHNHFGDKHLQ